VTGASTLRLYAWEATYSPQQSIPSPTSTDPTLSLQTSACTQHTWQTIANLGSDTKLAQVLGAREGFATKDGGERKVWGSRGRATGRRKKGWERGEQHSSKSSSNTNNK